MEIQHVCVPMTEYLWQRICGPFARAFAQAPVLSLICQCLVWMIIFYLFHRLQLFFQSRERLARHQKLSHGHKILEDAERNAIEQLCLKFQAGAADDTGGAAQESLPLISVSICVDDDSCGVDASRDLVADRRMILDAASQLRAPGQEVTVLQTCAGPIVQTKMTRPVPGLCAVDTLTTSTTSSQAAAKKRKSFLVQLGRWRIFRPSTGSEEARMLKLDDTNAVPVILHSSYAGGKLTVEGMHLRQATIQAATKNKCIKLDTNYNSTTEYVMNVMSDLKGLNRLEVFTFESGLPSKNLAEVCVVASKKMDLDEFKLNVNGSAVQIQNNNLRTVLRSIFPFTILAIYATKQILSSMMRIMETTNTTSVVAWLLPCVVVVSTQTLPFRIETTITETLKKMAFRAYHTLYFAAQCFISHKDPDILSIYEGVSRSGNQPLLKNQESSDFKSRMRALTSPSDSSGDSEDESQKNEEDMKATTHNSNVNSSAWEWPVYDSVYNKSTRKYDLVKRVQSKGTTNQMAHPFEVIHHYFKDLPWASQGEVCIHSPILMEIINELIPKKLGQSARCKKKVSLNRPELFQIREGLRSKQASAIVEQEVSEASSSNDSSTSNREKLLHLQHLLRFMDKEFEEIEQMYVAMKSEKHCVSWEMLWAFFPRGERVVYIDDVTDEKLCGDVLEVHYKKNQCDDELLLDIKVTTWDYDCKTWEQYSRKLSVPVFEGELEICSLNIYPIQFEEDPKATINCLLDHGSRFCELSMMQRSCFRNYKGSMVRYKVILSSLPDVIEKENADGRVMIDLRSFAKMNPAYPRLGTANPPNSVIRDNKVTMYDIRGSEDRMFAPAMVYGFSFRLKQWGSFSVGGFSNINFNTSAFDDLVMDKDTKDVIEKLVKRKLDDGKDIDVQEREQLDPIACKGEGLIFLCYGPPGTGKTLTAESLSEKLECPLWCLSVSELGITPNILEATLIKVFDVAASWGALLLIDEADVFLERRTTSDLTRNAMTGVFLRLLEYYQGVIFLTTNRDSTFDDAITSRIAMKVRYERLNENQRKTIWTKLCARVGLEISAVDLASFAEPNFNGREIRNIVTTAHVLSRSEDNRADVEINHVQKAFKVYKDSCKVWATAPHL